MVADGRPGVGAGHLARCLALAQSWRRAHGEVVLVDDPPRPTAWVDRYRAAGAEVAPEPLAPRGPGAGVDVVVIDGYDLAASPTGLPGAGVPKVGIDDHGLAGLRDCDLVVDQNLGASSDPYRRRDGTAPATLLGPRYALVRSEVTDAIPAMPADRAETPRRLLVAAGGDPSAATARLLTGVAEAVAARHGMEVVHLAGVTGVGAVLASVDVALSAAGITTWELAAFGIPSVLVAVSANQQPIARRAAAVGLALDGGDRVDGASTAYPRALRAQLEALIGDPGLRVACAAAGRRLVDGRGALRAATAARALLVRLRRAVPDDVRRLWEWANDPGARAGSLHPEPIGWDDHVAWFERTLAQPGSAIWLADDQLGQPVGQVRVDHAETGTGEISLSIAAPRRGEGWAAPLVAALVPTAARELGPVGLRSLHATVLADNTRSGRAFESADFDRGPDEQHVGRSCHAYTRRCDG